MSETICPVCDGTGYVETRANGPSGRWRMRVHPVSFGYQDFAFGQVWEPSSSSRTREETCETCDGLGTLTE